MNYRPFGTTGLKVSELGCGCTNPPGAVVRRDDREVLATLAQALSNGVNFFDTADIYAPGQAQDLVGRAVRRRRNSVVLAATLPWRRLSGLHLRAAIENSLRRLDTDRLDLLQLHDPPVATAETDGLLDLLASLKREGKVRFYGLSCRTACDAGYWLRYPGIASLHIRLNLASFQEVQAILHRAARQGIAIIARQPFAPGRCEKPDVCGFLTAEDRTLAQAALQFALQFPQVSVVMTRMRTREHLRESLQALPAPPQPDRALEPIDQSAGAYVN